MQNIITTQDVQLLDALNPQLKALIFKGTKTLKNLTAQCVLTSKQSNILTNETAQYWSVLITHCETLEMFLMQDENVKSIV